MSPNGSPPTAATDGGAEDHRRVHELEAGGTLLVGVADDGTVVGLADDFASLAKEGRADADRFTLHLVQLVQAAMGDAAAASVTVQMHTIDGAAVARVHVRPSQFPVEAAVTVEEDGRPVKRTRFYVRLASKTEAFTEPEKQKYVAARWG